MVTRRKFVKDITFTSLATLVGTQLMSASAWAAGKCGNLIDMTGKKRKDDANTKAVKTAKMLGYVEDIDKAVKAKKATRKEKDDNCDNCMLYVKKDGNKKCGTCNVIAGVQVHANGWCKSWVRVAKK